MPSLTDAILQIGQARKGPECTVAVALRTLPKPIAAEFAAALAGDVASTVLAKAMASPAVGHPVYYQAIQRHRRGDCAC